MTRNRRRSEQHGRLAETVAAWWLRCQGWRILATRLRTPLGEIDLIARRGRVVAFVEVKARATRAELDLAIDRHRLQRVAAAVNAVAHHYAHPADDIRIDVILLAPRSLPRRIVNAWQG